ncbi:MAG: alpha-ketoglutarate-dependent dioxygenase AlkB [Chitinophagales bacterium]|nr:alpha-ketoglutarate-dependent dioxygenase AlkB [Chitinophagales bacterium]MDW8273181.1 alpha-ketoglutarate-dependent dioxygenase AlkB [Chitinophagales bacterium]
MNLLPKDGEVYLIPAFFNEAKSNYYYDFLKNNICWKAQPIMLFGKWVYQPRLVAWYGDPGKLYSYSGICLSPEPWNDALAEIKTSVENVCNFEFNSVLLNFYRDQRDSMGLHSDDEKELGKNPVIASVSFGAERFFLLQHKKEKNLKLKLLLPSGSLLVMKGETQHFWKHGLPKCSKPCNGRINLTFRKILD